MNVNIYVNVGEETRERRGGLGQYGHFGHPEKIAPDMERLYTRIPVYIYIFFFYLLK